jgi:hypothetical protein
MSLSEFEKRLYNSYNIAYRKANNKPFKVRKDFTAIDATTTLVLRKLSSLFERNSSINIDEFFIAPYKVYGTVDYTPIDFFLTRKALKCYTTYVKSREKEDPDSDEVIERCKNACAFIYKYCRINNITLDQYKSMIVGTMPIIIQHLKDHSVNFYVLHALDCNKNLRSVGQELLDFLIPDFNIINNETRINYCKSTKLKHTLSKALDIIKQQLEKTNKQQKENK